MLSLELANYVTNLLDLKTKTFLHDEKVQYKKVRGGGEYKFSYKNMFFFKKT